MSWWRKNRFIANAPAQFRRALILAAEIAGLGGSALVGVLAILGFSADRFTGVGLWSNLVPFAGFVLLLALALFSLLRLWMNLRTILLKRNPLLPVFLALLVASLSAWTASRDGFRQELGNLRRLVGGTKEAEKITLAHQVFASYRRTDLIQMQRLIERTKPYQAIIKEAARIYQVDAEVLVGLGAAESSFLPRDSKDGGRGLFQITAPPKPALERVGQRLGKLPDWRNERHNTLLAAATLRHYLGEMKEDLFLGLLAYNIGPKNGGLRSIMRQYGAKDFATIQPYLQTLPRDYPIRVLTAALAYRLWRLEGRLPHYEEGNNALRVQHIGIPGLSGAG
ncbi:MAG: transglycosylase SLT domain-containing protein [Methylococcaceae bacterium]|nr:transglycosylase SLT domain-containing protein [Methylococcaceae bacterium]